MAMMSVPSAIETTPTRATPRDERVAAFDAMC